MAKCSECGFLAVWDVRKYEFIETSEHCRSHGFPERYTQHLQAYEVKCLIQKHDLGKEVRAGDYVVGLKDTVRKVITTLRTCNGFTPWIQGFHPKEHQEMIDRKSERRWRVIEGLIFAVAGGLVAVLSQLVTKPPIVNINPPTVNVTSPPVNVTLQPPVAEQLTTGQLSPPGTKHAPKPQQP